MPAPAAAIEFASQPTGELDLDDDHDEDASLRLRTMDNVLGASSPSGFAEREVT